MVKLTVKQRKAAVEFLTDVARPSWPDGKGSATKLSAYVKALEQRVYVCFYLARSLDAYRYRILELAFNIKHNGKNLVRQCKAEKLAILDNSQLAAGYTAADDDDDDSDHDDDESKHMYQPVNLDEGKHELKKEYDRQNRDIEQASVLEELKKDIPNTLGIGANESSFIKCRRPKCDGYVDFQAKNTRSADEPEKLFCTCTKCGLEWKQAQ